MSVILTYRSAGDCIIEAVNSVLGQSYHHVELLLIDDNGAENSQIPELESQFHDQKIRFIQNPVCGRVNALNLGVTESRYELCAIIDDDDIWALDKLTCDVGFLRQGVTDLVCCPEILFRESVNFPDYETAPSYDELSARSMMIKNRVSHSSIVCRKEILSYDTRYPVAHDYEFYLRILYAGMKIYKSDQARIGFRVHNSSFNRPKSWLKEFRNYVISARAQAEYIIKFGRYEYLIFPLLKIPYTSIRRLVKNFQIEQSGSGAPR